jgi:hypothetical protein
VLLSNNTLLDAGLDNPFKAQEGQPADGYIDMIGVKNGKNVALSGYEGEIVPDGDNGRYQFISKQKSARRKSLTDTNDNNEDFESISWQPANILKTHKDFYRPKNTAHGAWDPEMVPEISDEPSNTLMILQVYGNKGKSDAAVTHSFVELYNNTDEDINLSGYSLQYSEGGILWTKLSLTGTIPSKGSFLVLGQAVTANGGTVGSASGLDFTSVTPDQSWNLGLSAVQFKLCLMHSTTTLAVANPFTANNGRPIANYVDMFGAFDNDAEALDTFPAIIDGFEGDIPIAMLSKQKAARRTSLTDHDENAYDFASFDYRSNSSGNSETDRGKFKPRTTADGSYDPNF